MPPKRAAVDSDDEAPTTGRERKKMKVAFARTIPVQNAEAGPSRTTDSMKGLPSVIDVEKFTEARSFEVNAMHSAMKTASDVSTRRAWQALPRHLRRRAASHDPRRVPTRLREKARAEIDPVQKKTSTRAKPKRGAQNQPNRTEQLLKRQRDKTWLESHIWHAKRMIMETVWGYRLAIKPTEKAFRPSHRASMHGSILHDASYFALIEMKGSQSILKKSLEYCCDPRGAGPGAPRFAEGSRAFDTHIYAAGEYPFDLISPVTVIWRPSEQSEAPMDGKGKGKAKQSVPGNPVDTRMVWIRCHPAVFPQVYTTLQKSASVCLAAAARETPDKTFDVELADLREQVNVFEIMGPKSSQVIKGALKPVSEDKRPEFSKFWTGLRDLGCSGSLPRGMIVGFKVDDPRLTFPPKNVKPVAAQDREYQTPPERQFHSPALAQCSLWDADARDLLKKPKYKKKEIDDRKSKNLVPGTPLHALRQDDRIPVMLIQRSLESTGSGESQSIHGWTVILPAGWSMPFFSSLMFTGTRIAGLRESATQAFEAGAPHFPRDYITTPTYGVTAAAKGEEEKFRWDRKPPAKRPNYEKLETPNPWKSDWEKVLGIVASPGVPEGLSSTQRDMDVDQAPPVRPWVLRGSDIGSLLGGISTALDPSLDLLKEVNKSRSRRGLEELSVSTSAADLLRGALLFVRVVMTGRGAPEDRAFIYKMDDEDAKASLIVKHDKIESKDETQKSTIPPANTVIGYVTSGNFSLLRGKTFALGAISLASYLELNRQSQRIWTHPKGQKLLVKTRNCDGRVSRAAHLEVLS